MKDDDTGKEFSCHFTVVNDSDIERLLNNLDVPQSTTCFEVQDFSLT